MNTHSTYEVTRLVTVEETVIVEARGEEDAKEDALNFIEERVVHTEKIRCLPDSATIIKE
jgi:hypothetical protein